MSSPKKILFISLSAGMGHIRAAEALRLSVLEKYPGVIAEHVDMADYCSKLVRYPSTSLYASLVRHLPQVYGALYRASDSGRQAKIISKLDFIFNLNSKKLTKFIDNFNPDQIVCTHFLAALPLKKYLEKIPISMVVTDYTAHNIWFSPFVSKYFVANEQVEKMLNVDKEKIVISGIPIHPSFLQKKDNVELRKKLNINNEWPTALLMAGGFGLIDIDRVAEKILANIHEINLVAIAGKQKKKTFTALTNIPKTDKNNLIVLEFVENIDEWMRISDLIITKPGGMTVTECLYLQKPMILIDPIPGQEEANVTYLEKNNFGKKVDNLEDLTKLLQEILSKQKSFDKPALRPDPNEIIINNIMK